MNRRIQVSRVAVGEMILAEREAHHLRDVLRLEPGSPVEVFDDSGDVGDAVLVRVDGAGVMARVESVRAAAGSLVRIVVAAAVPKAARADWMVEKLCELGVDVFIPLAAERSVSLPDGRGKLERWQRLAAEAARQSRRRGVMKIDPLTPLAAALASAGQSGAVQYLSTTPGIASLADVVLPSATKQITLLIGPEGGWSPSEIELFTTSNVAAVSLTQTILRTETAAIAAATLATVRWGKLPDLASS